MATQLVANNIDVDFTFENLKAKVKLINLADQLFAKADDSYEDFINKFGVANSNKEKL